MAKNASSKAAVATVDNDYPEHEKTYEFFLHLVRWGTVATLVLLLTIGSVTGMVPWAFSLFLMILLGAGATVL